MSLIYGAFKEKQYKERKPRKTLRIVLLDRDVVTVRLDEHGIGTHAQSYTIEAFGAPCMTPIVNLSIMLNI